MPKSLFAPWVMFVVAMAACKTRPSFDHPGSSDLATADLATADLATADLASMCPLPSEPAFRAVTFHITNQSATERFVVTDGMFCDAFAISGIALHVGFQCLCECPALFPSVSNMRRLAPGASFDLTWDARQLATCTTPIDCAAQGWPNGGIQQQLHGSNVLAPSAAYEATFAIERQLPANCSASSSSELVSCSPVGPGGGPFTPAPAIQQLCASTETVTVAFDLAPGASPTVFVALD